MPLRLVKIKLAGFKSFVDPTTLEFTTPLVAIVGPNGCGKSNIIDAIRWVMGESSAKNLRGESLMDVIFNGSADRKPVGQATVELVFDNSDGSLGGEYAAFSEISIRRQGTRDNQSSYFLNGVRCRRKDITDIFLGTGLGPRSYAIIEQGMISRVIEAKPEELRFFLEEAAGVSVYRKRRQETETRMRHTRENLARLDDVRQELDKQLDRLKRQSESALKYQEYKKNLDILDIEVATLRWRSLNEQLQVHRSQIQTTRLSLEEKMAQRSNLDLNLEHKRVSIEEDGEKFNSIQAEYYDLGAHIARTEQTLEHYRSREQQLREEQVLNEENLKQIQSQTGSDQDREKSLDSELQTFLPQMKMAEQKSKDYVNVLQEAEEKMRAWNEGYESFQQASNAPQRLAEVEKTKIEQLEKQSREATTTLQRLQQESSEWDVEKLKENHSVLAAQLAVKESETQSHRARLDEISNALQKTREILQANTKEFDQVKTQQQNLAGRLVSTQALQQAALGKADTVVKDWLQKARLNENSRLAERIKVAPGFERAVATVLGDSLQAVCVSEINALSSSLNSFSTGEITFVEEHAQTKEIQSRENQNVISLPLLITKIESDFDLSSLLAEVYVVDTISQALESRNSLSVSASVVTKEGMWLGKHWLKVYRNDKKDLGIFERENEIKELQTELEILGQTLERIKEENQSTQEKLQNLEKERDSLYQQYQSNSNILKESSAKTSGALARLEHARNRMAKIQEETAMQKQKLKTSDEDTSIARLSLQKALDEMQDFTQRRQALVTERETMKGILQQANQENRNAKEAYHQMALKVEGLRAQLNAVREGLKRLGSQYEALIKQQNKLQENLAESKAPQKELQETLSSLLNQRIAVEFRLTEARDKLEQENQALKQFEKERSHLEEETERLRSRLESLRVESQGLEVRADTFQEKLKSYQVTAEEVIKTLSEEADEAIWVQRLEELTRKIERLGAINLAAIEEFQVESERKNYLDLQYKDLTEALETLENAIKKIDRETRARFRETFDKVNHEFQTLFPKLFGGGQANLELEGEDLLEAGVTVMARPPGKRNASIHLLSGGEKALTAVALVFSIFRLNPAPFCMLDEVDAPLDDANVNRFCDLVKYMSNSVQFMYVTHNKISMEMAHHLIGVTMKEPGVSRLVSVDVAKAYEMATA